MNIDNKTSTHAKEKWVVPAIEVVASVSDIATGDIDIDEDFSGSPLVS